MEYKVGEKDVKTRLDSFLYELDTSFTRSHYKNLIEEGHVLVNTKKVTPMITCNIAKHTGKYNKQD